MTCNKALHMSEVKKILITSKALLLKYPLLSYIEITN